MPTLVAKLAVSVAGAVVVMVGIEALRWRHPRAAATPLPPDEPAEEIVQAVPRFALGPAAAPRFEPMTKPSPGGSLAMARIFGRVLGDPDALEELEISLEDRTRSYEPKQTPQGHYEINLPVGDYAVHASAGDLVAYAEATGLTEEENREVTLTLVEGVSIEGKVEGCDGPCRDVMVRAATGKAQVHMGEVGTNDKGDFALHGLAPGRAYDLTFTTEGKRSLTLRGIGAPARNVVATLEPTPTLTGGFGIEPGQPCPMETVSIKVPEAGEREVSFDRACRFRIEELPEAESVHLFAGGEGWHFELEVPLPEHGDPPFLCLHPTCREPEPTPEASLAVLVTGGADRSIHVTATTPDNEEMWQEICEDSTAPCVVRGMRPAPGVTVHVDVTGCETRKFTLDIHAGTNHLTSPCEAVRMVHGLALGAKGGIQVRCSSSHPAQRFPRQSFRIRCPTQLTTVDYQLATDTSWRTAAIEPTEEPDQGLARITVD